MDHFSHKLHPRLYGRRQVTNQCGKLGRDRVIRSGVGVRDRISLHINEMNLLLRPFDIKGLRRQGCIIKNPVIWKNLPLKIRIAVTLRNRIHILSRVRRPRNDKVLRFVLAFGRSVLGKTE